MAAQCSAPRQSRRITIRLYEDIPEHNDILDYLDQLPKSGRGTEAITAVLVTGISQYIKKLRRKNRGRQRKEKAIEDITPVPAISKVQKEQALDTQTAEKVTQETAPEKKPTKPSGNLLLNVASNIDFG